MSAIVLSAIFALAALSSCGEDGAAPADEEEIRALIEAFALSSLPAAPYPPYNPFDPERIALGRLLFFDPILGGESAPWVKAAVGKDPYRERSHDVACGTCHHPQFGFADGRRLGAGVGGSTGESSVLGPDRQVPAPSLVDGTLLGLEPRNSPTVINTALNGRNSPLPATESFQFLDGRVALGLEAQALEPLVDRDEMAGMAYGRDVWGDGLSSEAIRDSVTARIRALPGYLPLFRNAFPGEIDDPADITLNHVSKALAAYERELVASGSRYDRFVDGDYEALTAPEQRGFALFFGKGLCGNCHFGPMLSDFSFHVQGAADEYDTIFPGYPGKDGQGHDFGRFHANPDEFGDQKYAFRTLTLREVGRTAPYFHSGGAATLEEVVDFYDRGGRGPQDISDAELNAAGAVRDPSVVPLGLTPEERRDLVAFMKTLDGELRPGPPGIDLDQVPARVPSGLLPPGVPTPAGPGPFYPESSGPP